MAGSRKKQRSKSRTRASAAITPSARRSTFIGATVAWYGRRTRSSNSGPARRRPTEVVDAIYLEDIAERTASAFLGVSLECARCHVHPLDGWTPADHRAFTNIFGQVRLEKVALKSGTLENWEQAAFAREVFLGEVPLQLKQADLDRRDFLATVSGKEHADAGTGAVVKPRLLGGPEVDFRTDARADVDALAHGPGESLLRTPFRQYGLAALLRHRPRRFDRQLHLGPPVWPSSAARPARQESSFRASSTFAGWNGRSSCRAPTSSPAS